MFLGKLGFHLSFDQISDVTERCLYVALVQLQLLHQAEIVLGGREHVQLLTALAAGQGNRGQN